MMNHQEVAFHDLEPSTNVFLKEVLVGLSKSQKMISPKFLYDKKGSEIFEEICKLEEYYPTRAESEILQNNAQEISALIGSDALIIEPGSGSGEKVKHFLSELDRPCGYVPVEISKDILLRMSGELREEFSALPIYPVCADFTQNLDLSFTEKLQPKKKVIFFPGSTIGNFAPTEALQLLKQFGRDIGLGGGLLIGVDLKKDEDVFERAYDDSQGVTAAFNLNLLTRLNREVEASFEPENFFHQAIYNKSLGRVEMHLVSRIPQQVKVHQTIFRFQEGETIHTESSYKYTVEEFCELAAKARFKITKTWMDKNKMFCVYYFEKD